VDKRDIFSDSKDIQRFLLCMELFSREEPVGSVQVAMRDFKNVDVERLQSKNIVSIVEYCLNPNHFHFILKEEVEGGISEFMKRLLGGYTKYFNDKESRSGSLFQGRFKSSYAEREKYFKDLFAYVMWNYKVHDIPKDKLFLVRTSEDEYRTGKFNLVNKKEGKKFLEWFGGYDKFIKHAKTVVSLIRKERGKKLDFDFNDQDYL